jgi:hypothetical protein
MFTLCFVPLAARNFRRARKVISAVRRPGNISRAVLAAATLLTAAGLAQAGNPNTMSFGVPAANGGNSLISSRSMQTGGIQANNPINFEFRKPTVLNSQDRVPSNMALPVFKPNLEISKLGKLPIDRKLSDFNQKFDPKFVKDEKQFDKQFLDKKIFDKKNFDKKIFDKKFVDNCHDHHFHHCPWWYCWDYPVWCPLYGVGCGYWYDVPVVEIRQGVDLQLLAVRMIDAGSPEQNLGPAFRVWIRNNSPIAIAHPFNVVALAARNTVATADLPQAGVRVDTIDAGQTLPVDIRLPVEANQPGFPLLHVLVDSHREIAEVFENNNGAVLARANILPVDEVAAN